MSDEGLRARLMEVYADEHREHLAALRAGFAPGAAPDLEEVYRHAHSLKGAARAVELTQVEALSHGLESLLQEWWSGRLVPDQDLTRIAAQSLDAIEDCSAAFLAARPQPNRAAILSALNARLVARGLAPLDSPFPPAPVPSAPAATFRVDGEGGERLRSTVVRLLAELDGHNALTRHLWGLGETMGAMRRKSTPDELPHQLDRMQRHHEAFLRDWAEREWRLNQLAETLRDDVARLRMVPAEEVLGGFGPMIRRLAGELGKGVDYVVSGLDTTADREVLRHLTEPVLHLLRNAIGHGIERPEERVEAGKGPVGNLELAVQAGGGRLVVRVRDDGRGLNTPALARQAIARGLMSSEEAEIADPERLNLLVFEPGLSTLDHPTALAGRGMGMSIVRKLVARLQGHVEVETQPGRGACFVVTVPVTVLAQRIVLVEVRGQIFGLPAAALARLVSVRHSQVVVVDGQTRASIEGEMVPLVDLGTLLDRSGEGREGDSLCVAVMRSGAGLLGLVADLFRDVRDLPVQALDPPLSEDARLGGTVVLEDGRLALVLAPAGIASARSAGALPMRAPAPRPKPLVLVVDDSVTTRTLEKSLLEAHGYRVRLAVNGQEALDAAADERPDLVLSDVEMPHMDGFELLNALKRDSRLASVPVILVTSRADPEDQARGLRLGAAAYIIKSRFDQDRLLEAVGRLA